MSIPADELKIRPNCTPANHSLSISFLKLFGIALGLAISGTACEQRSQRPSPHAVRSDVQIAAFETALSIFEEDCGRLPTTPEGLAALLKCPADNLQPAWKGPYLDPSLAIPADAWGRPYVYRYPGIHNTNGADLFSLGPDGKTASQGDDPDDINNWRNRKTTAAINVRPVIRVENEKLSAALDMLASQAGVNIQIAPETGIADWDDGDRRQPRVNIRWTNLTGAQALEGLLRHYNLQLVELVGTSVHVATVSNLTPYAPAPPGILEGPNTVVSVIQMDGVPLDVALSNLAAQIQFKMTFDVKTGSASEKESLPWVKFRWKNITARQAFVALIQIYRLKATMDSATGVILVRPG